ncbi:superoxide dismutase family protein [Streptomyces alkaliterrae]|uniref:Superoxide dismutase family protein n=1 Tax=Streptomyces alkaliterrae TaxID=2213162 RepID=A0A5P0YYJ3_9ACTN|nr:superoxide dismutase family protein [Streptomyces alkaliterrae]MBB1256929.1 superoxide dismutase family protein [Streptomyces alkaliterrae]MBB1260656.1 superoxide dismutase family protein [Streptomyces alkaliterrae]MQS03509.1 superoxide dismutase family protein [Streptomyces alkaliterrae]
MTGVTRRATVACAALVAVLATAAPVSAGEDGERPVGGAAAKAPASRTDTADDGEHWLATGGHFQSADRRGGPVPAAVTYDRRVPEGAGVTVAQRLHEGGRTSVRLWVDGVEPGRIFGAHVHTKPCGKAPEASGPHYQDEVDPVQPSVDPRYANPDNEVWLDFKADRTGVARSSARQQWTFRPGEARSVVIHEHETHMGEGHAGQAGARLACVTVPFLPAR